MSSDFGKKRKRIPGTESSGFLFFSSFDHMLKSEEASELFVGFFTHDSALTFPRTLGAHDMPVLFSLELLLFFFTDQKARSALTGLPLIRRDYRFFISLALHDV